MSAFRQVVAKIQDNLSNEALIGLEFVLRLDPTFAPGIALQEQLISGRTDIDLSTIIAQLGTPNTDAINLLLIEAVEEFNQHNYLEAKEKVEKVLVDLPGHADARSLAAQIDDALKVETQVGQFLTQAKEALAGNRPQDAANFVLMAQALDPHHAGIEATLTEIHRAGTAAENGPGPVAAPFSESLEPPETPPPADDAIGSPVDFGTKADFQPSPPLFRPPTADPSPVEGDRADVGGFSTDLADEAQSDSWDVAGAFEEPAIEPDQDLPQTPEPGVFEPGGDVADLFETSSESDETPLWDEPESPQQPQVEDPELVDDLLARGTAALEAGDPQEALRHLPRILLIDPENSKVEALIERARAAINMMENQLQASLSEAEMAWDSGEKDRAHSLIEEVLIAAPGNEEALALKARFDTEVSTAPPPPPPPVGPIVPPEAESAPDPEEGPLESLPAPEDLDSGFYDLSESTRAAGAYQPAEQRAGRQLPLRWIWVILGIGAVAVVLVGMWLGSSFLPQGEEDVDTARVVSERIENAQLLFDQGKTEEALDLLRTFDVEGIDKQRVDKHIARIQASLIPPTPTPIPESVMRGRDLMDDGRWLEAYQTVGQGLSQHPGDSGLLDLKEQITSIEPRVSVLFGALSKRDFQTGTTLAQEMAERHTDQEGFGLILDRCLFNAALANLRSYNLTGARGYLNRLQERHPDDKDVSRILDFISSYSSRPVDMQLEIFIGSLDFR